MQNASCLFLVYPFSFEGKLIQYIGRVQRSEIAPTIYDYRDGNIDYLNKLFLKRNTYYRKLVKEATLFDDPQEEPITEKKITTIEKIVKIQIEQLEFGYGVISFQYNLSEINNTLTFVVNNNEIRPELEVLKPYFGKALKAKSLNVNIHLEYEDNLLVAQLASSADFDKINNELIEGIRFQFIAKNVLGNTISKNTVQSISEIKQMHENHALYDNTEELLEDILKRKQYKHTKQIQYLADNHLRHILKLRFVLSPFSFVFLLEGMKQFHVILETLDTEEATYLWHFNNDVKDLPNNLKEIDQHLNIIRDKGRQVFLENIPSNFTRILHDYLDDQKGFFIWKSLLEEQLV